MKREIFNNKKMKVNNSPTSLSVFIYQLLISYICYLYHNYIIIFNQMHKNELVSRQNKPSHALSKNEKYSASI